MRYLITHRSSSSRKPFHAHGPTAGGFAFVIGGPLSTGRPERAATDLRAIWSRRLAFSEDEDVGRNRAPHAQIKPVAQRLDAEQVVRTGDHFAVDVLVESRMRIDAAGFRQIEHGMVLLGVCDEHDKLRYRPGRV